MRWPVEPYVRSLVADRLGVGVEELAPEGVRTYGDLVATVAALASRVGPTRAEAPARVRARIVPAAGVSSGTLERADWLTTYCAETVTRDALRAGPGARLEVSVAAGTEEAAVGRLEEEFAWLRDRDIHVSVCREPLRHTRRHPAA